MEFLVSIGWFWYAGALLLVLAGLVRHNIGHWRKSKGSAVQYQPSSIMDASQSRLEVVPAKPAKPRIKITRRDTTWNQKTSLPLFNKILVDHKNVAFDTNLLWPDTIINKIYLKAEFCQSLHSYLLSFAPGKNRRIDKIDTEVGGFLLGKYTQVSETDTFQVIVETFVSINSEQAHHLHLAFDTHSLSVKLGEAQDRHPDQVVVGWFHTHPGHGLFLSKLDLAIHKGFFNEPFQFAMEIDSLSPSLDLGFFTHKKNGEINHTKHEGGWFSWRKIEKEIL